MTRTHAGKCRMSVQIALKNIIGMMLSATFLGIVSAPSANAQVARPPSAPTGRADSVLVELQQRDTKLRNAVDSGLKPAVDNLKRTLADSVASAKAALERAKSDNT